MTVRNLDKLFRPSSVAVIGASNRPDSVGQVIMRNMLDAGFEGPIMPVNPGQVSVAGVIAHADVESLPVVPDLAVICTPPATVPGLIDALGRRGTKAAVVITAGVDVDALLRAAQPYLLRILGHNCVGLLVPGIGLNASFAPGTLKAGNVAFVSQSGALCTAVLDWAAEREIGFSHFISLGNCADVDFGDVIDYLAQDDKTRAILLYIESISHARKFLSASRAASRAKPIVAIKSGRNSEGARAAASHTGALAGRDDVYEAALARGGVLRVDSTEDLFEAVETLARARRPAGEGLVILTNGGGLGVMAADALAPLGGSLVALSNATKAALDGVLPRTWSHGNPVDIIGDAPGARYADALGVLLDAPEADTIIIMHAPTGITSSDEVARGVIERIEGARKTVLTNWMGGRAVKPARAMLENAAVPSFETPGAAVRAYMQLIRYRRLQSLLTQTPPAQAETFKPDMARARAVIDGVLAEGRDLLTEFEAKELLDAYEIPIVATRIARDADEAAALAEDMSFPVVVKILSRDISHKSDVGGVALNLKSADAVRAAVDAISKRVGELRPEAVIDGFTVQQMVRRPGAHELLVGAFVDDVFGPVIMFGQGGTAVEVVRDRAVSLPPLNPVIARHLMSQTRIYRLLEGYRDRPKADLEGIVSVLLKVAQLVADLAEVAELDINPLLADDHGAIALDARVVVKPATIAGIRRLAIRPYPSDLEETVQLPGGERVLLRPIRPEDEPAHLDFFQHLDSEDLRLRFFNVVKSPSHEALARFTQIDYDREMCFIATRPASDGHETVGVVRAIADPDNERAEYAVIIRSDLKGSGLGQALMDKLIRYARQRGIHELHGTVLSENTAMRDLATRLGFTTRPGEDASVVETALAL
ncbi:bifunctional acetate--CoA ligase family protein/GNAT family N-acetyltransferase [Iodidimonas sp. SYSU 1G8]|uniref:bifunctional acetate--CoA ligase family protein/GNAT family N-acetyltransferase n=1 Tax=Iodidimonas sp. SYSU 1G8 TaxID=3133967 RepID=UPI0031FF3AB1